MPLYYSLTRLKSIKYYTLTHYRNALDQSLHKQIKYPVIQQTSGILKIKMQAFDTTRPQSFRTLLKAWKQAEQESFS